MLMDAKIKKLENEIVQACLNDKLRMTRQDTNNHTTTLEDCCLEFWTLLPWLRSHLTKQRNQGSAPHKEEHAMLTIARVIEECPRTRLEGEFKSRTSGATT